MAEKQIAMLELEQIDGAKIIELIEEGRDEGFRLEFKEGKYSQKNFNYDIRKTLSAFANHDGGLILIGIKDKKNSKDPLSVEERLMGSNITEANQWLDEIRSKDLIIPSIYVSLKDLQVKDKIVCAIQVSKSYIGPIAIKLDVENSLEFWQRGNGSDMRMNYMTLQDKFDTSQAGLIKAAFVDLMSLYTALYSFKKNIKFGNIYNPTRITSAVVDNRLAYYALLAEHHIGIEKLNTLSNAIFMINETIQMHNAKYLSRESIENIDALQNQFEELVADTQNDCISLVTEFKLAFPELMTTSIKGWEKHYKISR